VGNPVRPEFREADPAKGRAFLGIGPQERILLVLGGSPGARAINELVRENLPELTGPYVVVHQTGPGWEPPEAEARYRPYPYFKGEMPHILAAAELVLGRSGAGALWECAALGRPMVLIPLRGPGTRGDQVENARYFEKAGAAVVLQGGAGLGETVRAVAADGERRAAMSRAAAAVGAADSAALIAREVLSLLKKEPL
jgi:UDP-N-acetylglucosamine--N-acetylmuramyl-(pentapeptide) pyrophosphoryl-undecaprenol N-acetylglucosamine transferase